MKTRVIAVVPVLIVVLLVVARVVLRLNRPDAEPDVRPLSEADVEVQCAVYSVQLQEYLASFSAPAAAAPADDGGTWVALLRQLALDMDCESDASRSMLYYCSVVSTEPGEYASIDDVPIRVCRGEPPALDRGDAATEDEAAIPDMPSQPAPANRVGATVRA